jgi:glycine betaine/proline transport system substrate-binding protein
VLRRFKWSNDDQNSVANLIAGQHMDPEKAAETWIKSHPKQVKQWLG